MGALSSDQIQTRLAVIEAEIATMQAAAVELRRQLAEQGVSADPGRHRRPHLRLVKSGALVAPVVMVGGWFRDSTVAKAATLAAASVVAVPATLGVSVADARIEHNPPPRSTMQVYDAEPSPGPRGPQPSTPPTTAAVSSQTAGVVESEPTPPAVPAPTSAPTPTPTVTPLPVGGTLPVDEPVPPVEVVVWTRATATAHCRTAVPPVDLRGCVEGLLGG